MTDFYGLVMFPYPSGSGLHLGHWYNYAIMDSYFRWLRYYDKLNVFQPFGYDAFGLPAENYAIQTGRDAKDVTMESIDSFSEEMKRMNTLYETLVLTCSPDYYKWTQWLFLQLLKHNLVEKKFAPVNFCPGCKTVLANEQVRDDRCDRCRSKIEQKNLNQWFFKITQYKDRLIKNLDYLDYPEKTKHQQLHWLSNLKDWCVSRQRKWGCPIPVAGETDTLDTFVDSSFYFLRYCDPLNTKQMCDKDKVRQVDLYVGGNEHACMHLIYARFINMFLYDIGVTPFEEPFKKLFHQGMIRYQGIKMSKSSGNDVSTTQYNPDVLRLYLMFLGPYDAGGVWNDRAIVGIERFLDKFQAWTGQCKISGSDLNIDDFELTIDKYVKRMKFNKVVSEFMILMNQNKSTFLSKGSALAIRRVLNNFAPGI